MMLALLFTSRAWFAPAPHPPLIMLPRAPAFAAPLARAFAKRGRPLTLAQ